MTKKRQAYCETCGNLFEQDRVGITMTITCPNCGSQADVISYQEYKKLLKQKELDV